MSIVYRYLTRQVMVSMLAVSGVLLMVFMSGRFIKYLASAAQGDISGEVLFVIMGYRLPGFLELILPLGFFIGILLAHGRMYLESEMTVMLACGISEPDILRKTLVAGIPVMAFVAAMSLWVTPWGMGQVDDLIAEQRNSTGFELLTPGRFQDISGGSRVVYTQDVSDDKSRLEGVLIAQLDRQSGGLTLISADQGSQVVDEEQGDRFLVLSEGTRFQGMPGALDFTVTEFGEYGLRIEKSGASRDRDEESLPTLDLLRSDDPELRALWHWRLSLPLIIPVVTLIAVKISRVNPRQGRFFHLLPAMLLYIAYLGLLIVGRDAIADRKVPEWLGLFWVHGLFALLGLWLNFGPPWLRRRRLEREARHA